MSTLLQRATAIYFRALIVKQKTSRLLMLVTILQLICEIRLVICLNNSLQFNYRDFYGVQSSNNISLQYSSGVPKYSTFISLLPDPDPSWHTDPLNQSALKFWAGWMAYNQSIQFLDPSNRARSFNTSFTFSLTTPGQYNQCPSGMVFVVLSTPGSPSNSTFSYFGLSTVVNASSNVTNPFFTVEFDTYKSIYTNDPSGSHIGIDINNVNSLAITDTSNSSSNSYYPELYLYNNNTFRAWISYDASLNLTRVWMTNKSEDYSAYLNPPHNSDLMPILQLQYDLSLVFALKNMYIGFSAGTESNTSMLGASIYSWYFSIGEHTTISDTSVPWFKNLKLIIPIVVIIAFLATLSMGLFYLSCKGKLNLFKSTTIARVNINDPFSAALSLPLKYSFRELQSATKKFDSITSFLGEGGFSKVYKGKLPDGSVVAIKRLKDGVRKEVEFSAELKMINTIRHRNILQLQGWCYENGETLLVYKFMINGSLDRFIFSEKRGSLDRDTRLRILSGVAEALEYLHFRLGDCILHRDVKAANVLLTEDFEAVLGDFGLARLIKHNEAVTATMVGTVGYVAAEVVMEGKVTDKADVYSFEVLTLEVACGRKVIIRNAEPHLEQSFNYLVEHVSQLHRRHCLFEALDPSIIQLESSLNPSHNTSHEVLQQWMHLLQLGLLCCHRKPECRPDMRYVNQEIHNIIMKQFRPESGSQPLVEFSEISVEYPFLNVSVAQPSGADPSWNSPSTYTISLPR